MKCLLTNDLADNGLRKYVNYHCQVILIVIYWWLDFIDANFIQVKYKRIHNNFKGDFKENALNHNTELLDPDKWKFDKECPSCIFKEKTVSLITCLFFFFFFYALSLQHVRNYDFPKLLFLYCLWIAMNFLEECSGVRFIVLLWFGI